MDIEHRHTRPKPEYENPARFFELTSSKSRNDSEFTNEYTESNAAIRSAILAHHKILTKRKYFRPRSHRVEVAAVGDPRTNGDSNFYYHYYYQESKATGRPPLPTNSSLQTLKLQPHASPHLGTDLRIAQLSNIGSFDHHLSTTDRAFATNAGTQN
ncbi:hypothetical protein V1477_000511 [Vespula maculifrons]|uniref:Uncharacterized protein n=1 Tax=Vespula maculifrons TaxID=7453 RepID=A0ABD2D3U6_VESMC